MNFLSICSGIEAASVAWEPLGWQAVGLAEIEPFPAAVLKHHYPETPNFGDMTAYANWSIAPETVDVLVGGTPCQAFSVAGRREGLADARGNLSLVFCDLADHFDPEWIVWENVPGVLSSKDNAFGCFLAGLCGASEPLIPDGRWGNAGLVSGPKRTVVWRVLDAQFFGVAQRRRRVFVLAVRGSGNWRGAAALFPVGDGLHWHSPPSREAREGVAPCLSARTKGGGGLGTDFDLDGGLVQAAISPAVTSKWAKGSGGPSGDECQNLIAHTLRGEGFDASEDGTGRGTPLVPAAVAFAIQDGREIEKSQNGLGVSQDGAAYTVDTTGAQSVAVAAAVRRLTPRECERLQGFPDDYTRIPWRGKPAEDCPDGPRYKALGNSMAVPVMQWIGERIKLINRLHQ